MNGDRRNNKIDMSITEQLEAMKDKICLGYCKYYEEADSMLDNGKFNNETDMENFLNETCKSCPLMEL